MDSDFKNKFFENLKNENIDVELIESLDELIKYNKFTSDNITGLIDGEFDE